MPAPNQPTAQKAEAAPAQKADAAAPKEIAPAFEPIAHTLKYPVMDGADTVTVITINRRPTARDMITSAGLALGNPAEQDLHTLSSVTGVNPDILQALDAYDYTRLSGVLAGFLSD